MTQADDVATLDEPVRSAAVVLSNRELMWPYDLATSAVDALAKAGHIVLGVDARGALPEADVTEIAVSSFEPAGDIQDVERARQAALAALAQVEQITGWHQPDVLLTW